MNTEEMLLEVCKKLPNTPKGELQICHEAEMLLTPRQYREFLEHLSANNGEWLTMVSATYEQRLTALCKVWFPEKFI